MPKTELHGLALRRGLGQQVIVDTSDGRLVITVVETGEYTKLLFTGPREIAVWRGEIVEKREGER